MCEQASRPIPLQDALAAQHLHQGTASRKLPAETGVERTARHWTRAGYLYIDEHSATRPCHHMLTYRLYPELRICCGCGKTSVGTYEAAIIREAFE